MRAVLLAAGHSEITTGPISNIEIRGIRLLDLQVSFLRNAGAEQIILVAGHASEKVSRADIEIRKNHFWMGNGSISSLEAVSDLLDGTDDVLIAYGDTLFDVSVINKLTKSSAPVSIIGLTARILQIRIIIANMGGPLRFCAYWESRRKNTMKIISSFSPGSCL